MEFLARAGRAVPAALIPRTCGTMRHFSKSAMFSASPISRVKRNRLSWRLQQRDPVEASLEAEEQPEQCSCPQQQQALQEIAACRNWDAAATTFRRLSAPELPVCNAMLRLAQKTGQLQEAFGIYAEMRRRAELSARTYSALIQLAGRVHPALAYALLAEMRAMQVEPNGHTYLAIFNVYKISRDVDGAKLAWQDMRAAGVRPIAPAVSAVMSAVAKTGDIQATQALLEEAKELGFVPTRVAYNCILDAAHVAGDADAAFRILSDMRAAGVTTDVISYNSALGALQASNRPGSDRARLLQEMKSDGVSPNSLFLERQLSYILDLPREEGKVTGQDELQSHLQGLSAEVRKEALEAVRECKRSDIALTKLVQALRVALERLEEPSAQDGPGSDRARTSGDWVKVLAKDEAGSQIEYYWDRLTGNTQWEHPGCELALTVPAA